MPKIKISLPQPIGARLLIEPDKLNTGALQNTLPTAKETATVLAVGNAWNHEEEPVKVGDRVHVKGWAHDIVKDGEKTYTYIWQKTGGFCGVI